MKCSVLWTDECTVMLECHRRFCWRKSSAAPQEKSRAKHPCKVHVWAGIGCQCKTLIVIFDGKMFATGFIEVLKAGLIPYYNEVNKKTRLMQESDPKHTSARVWLWFQDTGVNWWKTPAESPDFNLIENLWHELKEHNQRVIKPTTKDELVAGTLQFWETVNIAKCKKYFHHLKKVVPKVIETNGGPTGY